MQVTKIVVHAGRTFNHPHESYSNLRPSVTLEATLDPGEDPIAATKQLQAQAEQLVEDHKTNLLESIEDLYQLNEHNARVRGLQHTIENAQRELDKVRSKFPQLAPPTLEESIGSKFVDHLVHGDGTAQDATFETLERVL